MKLYSKKVNRGLLLAGICLILFLFYVIAEQVSFTGEKDQIQSVLEGYLSQTEQLNASSVSFHDAIPLLETHWSTGTTALDVSWADMAIALHTFFSSDSCEIDKIESTVGQYQIARSGTNGALITCTYSLTADIRQTGTYFLICRPISLQELTAAESDALYRLSGTLCITADLVYEQRSWKIIGVDVSVLEQNIQPISE